MARLTGKDGAFHYWRSLVPVDPRERALSGHQPPDGNAGHDSAPWGSMDLNESLETAAALSYALDGNESDGTIASSTGHLHQEGVDTYLGWLQLGSWPMLTGFASGGDLYYNTCTISSTTATPIALIPFILPAGATHIIFRANLAVDVDDAASATLRLRFYRPANINGATPDVDGGHLSSGTFSNTANYPWLESAPIDLSGVATTSGKRIVYCRVDVSVPSSKAYLAGFQIALSRSGARLTDPATLDTSAAAPDVTLTGATLESVYKTNTDNLTDAVYGTTRPTPRVLTPHDHGQGGGETLDRHLVSMSYGPHAPEGSGGTSTQGAWGLPLNAPAAGVSFTTTAPKLIAQHAIFVPGGVANVTVRLAGEISGSSMTMRVEARPLGDGGYTAPAGRAGVAATISLNTVASPNLRENTGTLDLTPLGSVNSDRVLEFCVWQASNPSTSVNRLLSLLLVAGTAPTFLPDSAHGLPREEVPVAKIREGQEVSTALTARFNATYNQICYAAIGGVPGLDRDLHTPLTDDPWRRLLVEPHQHRGVDYTDPVTGERVNDGAIVRVPLICTHYAENVAGGSPENTTVDADPARGTALQNGYTTTGTRKVVALASLGRGLGAIDVVALLEPGTDETQNVRLFCLAEIKPLTRRNGTSTTYGDDIVVTARSGRFRGSPLANATGVMSVQVDPQDGAVWQRNSDRLGRGLALWSQDAKLRDADLPDGTSSTNMARWTQPIRIEITPSDTLDHRISLTFVVQIGTEQQLDSLGGTFDADARLVAVLAVPSAGY